MPVRIYAHLTWTCWARLPLIDQPVAEFLLPFLLGEAKRHGARVIEIGVVPNHVHLLLELPPAYDVPRLVQLPQVANYVRLQELKHGAPTPRQSTSPSGLA